MRRHGWGGDLPENDEAALGRVLDAARELVAEQPDRVPSISDVAERLSVTRQTVYRYFPSVQALLLATVNDGIEDFLDATAAHVAPFTDPAEAVVECIAFAHEEIGRRPDIGLVLASEIASPADFVSDVALGFARAMLDRLAVDWDAEGFDEIERAGLVEMMLRTLMSFVYTPGEPQRTPDELRAYLRRWIAPAVVPPDRAGAGVGARGSARVR